MINKDPNIDRASAIEQGGYYGQKGTWNQLYTDPKTGKLLRDRVEVLVIKDDKELFLRMYGNNTYRLPGGGKEHDKTPEEQAIAETREEARLNITNCRDTGIEWCRVFSTPGEKAYLEGDKNHNILWYGDHTNLYIADFESYYDGEVKDIDQDKDLTSHGKFMDINLIWIFLKKEHKDALKKFGYEPIDEIVASIEESTNLFQLDELVKKGMERSKTLVDKLTLEQSIQNRLDRFNIIKEDTSFYPYFTPYEMESMGVFKEANENFYKSSTDNSYKEWFETYKATGNPGSNYYDMVMKESLLYKQNKDNLHKQRLLEMGWNPEVEVNIENLKRARTYTSLKINEMYNPIEIVDIHEDNNSLVDTVENTLTPLIHQIQDYIKTFMKNTPEYDEIESYIIINSRIEFYENGTAALIFRYDLETYGNKNDKYFEYVKRLKELVNGWLITQGHVLYYAEFDDMKDGTPIEKAGVLLVKQRNETGNLDYVRENYIEECPVLGIVSNATPGHKNAMSIDPTTTRLFTKKELDEKYNEGVLAGKYSGDPDIDFWNTISEQEGNGRKHIIESTKNIFNRYGLYPSVSKVNQISFLSEQSNEILFISKEQTDILSDIKQSLYEEFIDIDNIKITSEDTSIKITLEKSINESSIIQEGNITDRKGLLSKVKEVCLKCNHPLKISKNGRWGEKKFISGDSDTLCLVCGNKNYEQMKRDLDKELKGTGVKITLDNYYSVFLTTKHSKPVSEDTILETKSKNKLFPIYIVNSFTDTRFGRVITKYTGDSYSHSAIALDSDLKELYTFNANNSHNLLGGFNVESIEAYKQKSDISRAQINVLFVGEKVYDKLKEIISGINVDQTKYNFKNLFNILIHREDPNQDVNSMICSQFVDNILKTVSINLTNMASNLVTPGTLAKVQNPRVFKVYEGLLKDFDINKFKNKVNKLMHQKIKPIAESRIRQFFEIQPVLEAKEFPVQFDADGNLLISKGRKMDYNSEWKKTKRLRETYKKQNNIAGMKYEAAKCWYINQCIEEDMKDFKHSYSDKEDLALYRSRILTEFSQYMREIQKVQDDFNFTAYYNSTPFSDDKTQINASTLKYSATYIKNIFKNIL